MTDIYGSLWVCNLLFLLRVLEKYMYLGTSSLRVLETYVKN